MLLPARRGFFYGWSHGGVETDAKVVRIYQKLLTVDISCDILLISDRHLPISLLLLLPHLSVALEHVEAAENKQVS